MSVSCCVGDGGVILRVCCCVPSGIIKAEAETPTVEETELGKTEKFREELL